VVYVFVTTETGADLTRLGDDIRGIVGAGCQVTTQASLPGEISRAVAITAGSTAVFVLLILVTGGLLIVRAVLSSVRERVVEIGILKAIGWRRRDVVRLIGLETLLQGALGAVPGAVLGYITAFVACRHMNLTLPGTFNSYPACATTAPASELLLTPTVGPAGVIAVLLLTVLLALVAGTIAGRVVASRPPMESLRQA
jgi:putative ABC transport system permease protein